MDFIEAAASALRPNVVRRHRPHDGAKTRNKRQHTCAHENNPHLRPSDGKRAPRQQERTQRERDERPTARNATTLPLFGARRRDETETHEKMRAHAKSTVTAPKRRWRRRRGGERNRRPHARSAASALC